MEVLVVVDMQKDFIDGVLGSPEAVAIVPKITEKIQNFSGEVFFTQDTHFENYLDTQEGKKLPVLHCAKETEGWRIHPDLEVLHKSMPILKNTFGSIKLGEILKEIDQKEKISRIILVGVCTDICVISNAFLLKAFLPETEILVDAACCAGVTPERHQIALEAMGNCQIQILKE